MTLGILPAACGTQRFPRLVGLKKALELITSGRRFGINEASKLGLVDQVTYLISICPSTDLLDKRSK